MPTYKILNDEQEVINTIIAKFDFVEKHYPGYYEEVPEPIPVPQPIMIITKLAFKRRFTMSELAAFKTLTKTDATAEVFDDLINIAEDVTLDDPMLTEGMAYLVTQGILTEQRKVEILTPEIGG